MVSLHTGCMLDGIEVVELITDQQELDGEGQLTMVHPSEIELTETTRKVFGAMLAQISVRYRRQILALKRFFSGRRCTVMLLAPAAAFRGSDFASGFHEFKIHRGGLAVFPLLVAANYGSDFADGTPRMREIDHRAPVRPCGGGAQ